MGPMETVDLDIRQIKSGSFAVVLLKPGYTSLHKKTLQAEYALQQGDMASQ